MILRHVKQHFRKQEWTAIGIDFLIVVIGVFMGIQVANWNDAQIKKGRETTYLQGVVEDIDNDVIEIEEVVLVTGSRMSALALLIESASDWRVPREFSSSRGQILVEKTEEFDASSEFPIGIELFILSTLDGNRLAYETMINADGIGVIRNKTLVSKIQQYYALVDKTISFELSLEENRIRLIDTQQQAGISAVDDYSVKELAEHFRGNRALLAAAKNYWLYANRHLKLARDLQHEARNLVDLIKKELAP